MQKIRFFTFLGLFVFSYLLFVIGVLIFIKVDEIVWLLLATGFLFLMSVHTIYYLLFYFVVVDMIDMNVKKYHLFILPLLYSIIMMFANGILKAKIDAFPFASLLMVDVCYVIFLLLRGDRFKKINADFIRG